MKFFINWSHRVPIQTQLKDTDNEKARYMKNQSLTKSMNIDIWLACTLNQLLMRGSYTQIKSKKKKKKWLKVNSALCGGSISYIL